MDTYSVAAPTGGYVYVNTDPSSAYYMWLYRIEPGPAGSNSTEHIYGDGRIDYVKNGSSTPVLASSGWAPPAGTVPPTLGSGGIPGEPVATPVPPPAPPSPPPASPPGGTGSSGSGSSGGGSSSGSSGDSSKIISSIEAQQQELEGKISSQTTATTPQQVFQTGEQVSAQVDSLMMSIDGDYKSGLLTQSQAQQMQIGTIDLGVRSITQEVNSLEQQGGVTTGDQAALETQYKTLSQQITILSERGDIEQGSMVDVEQQMNGLENKITAMQSVGSTGGGTSSPPGTLGSQGGGSQGGSQGNTNNPGTGSSGSTGGNDNNAGTGTETQPGGGVASTGVVASTGGGSVGAAPAAPAGGGGTYTVQSGDSMWAIAQANGISLSELESLNPQIQNARLIIPGQQITLPAGTGTPDSSGATAAPLTNAGGTGTTYTVNSGDTLSAIAAAHGMSLQQIEALNPQIQNANLIFPNQVINLGGGSAAGAGSTTDGSSASAQPTTTSSGSTSVLGGANANGGISSGGSGGSGAIDFPDKSSYPSIGSKLEDAAAELTAAAKNQGWEDGSGSGTTDVAKGVFEVDNQTSTDPLKIDDKK